MSEVINLSAYKFAPLVELPTLQERLRAVALAAELKGTILLSPEGINLFVAGTRAGLQRLLETIREVPGLHDLTPKESPSASRPFERMLVKIKKEIIAFGVDGISPALQPARKLSPRALKEWLDAGHPVTLLDTRNDYEVKLGTFHGALAAGIDHFRDFPASVRALPERLKSEPVVMFCTGGIRCEKAAPFMEREGFKDVYQLEGGILKYFEECGGAHYEGECFVFDQRVGVAPSLEPTGAVLCSSCQMPVTVAQQQSAHYLAGQSCPHCHGANT